MSPHKFVIHTSQFGGLVTGITNEAEHLIHPPAYSCYQLVLTHVAQVFGTKMQHWNVNYDKAQMIFNSTISRAAVQAQHKGLYREGVFRTSTVPLCSGHDFLSKLKFGIRDNQRRFYTYVILDKDMRFSETGAAIFTDFMSKHAMHSNAREEVRYSGEFHIQPTEEHGGEQKYKLVIDNNSGTYAPNKDDLPLLQRLFNINFPDIEVEALDRSDPKMEIYKTNLRVSSSSSSISTSH